MTSSQPVVTPQAINFTPDNKQAYAYSGLISTDAGNYVNAIQFDTNSEYIDAHLEMYVDDTTPIGQNDAYGFRILFNDVTIARMEMDDRSTPRTRQNHNNINFLIPPFTNVKIELYGESTETNFATFMLKGEAIGMTETGYQ